MTMTYSVDFKLCVGFGYVCITTPFNVNSVTYYLKIMRYMVFKSFFPFVFVFLLFNRAQIGSMHIM
jgi:hypothetical protein